jgi:DNA invertase Pin-like site-specific DNA recombinase
LKAAGCDVIRAEKRSGTSTEGREELRIVLDFLRKGDVLMVTRIDRLARSIGDLQDIVRTVRARGASLKAQGLGATEIAKALSIGRASVYRALAES